MYFRVMVGVKEVNMYLVNKYIVANAKYTVVIILDIINYQ